MGKIKNIGRQMYSWFQNVYHSIAEYVMRNYKGTYVGAIIMVALITGFGIGCSLSFDFTPVPFVLRFFAGMFFTILIILVAFVGSHFLLGGKKVGCILLVLNYLCIYSLLDNVCSQYEDSTRTVAILAAVIFDLFGRSLWALLRYKRHTITILTLLTCTTIVIGGMGYLFMDDGFSHSNIKRLYELSKEDSTSIDSQDELLDRKAFEEAIQPGNYEVLTLEYGVDKESDLISGTYNVGRFASRKSVAGKVMDRYFGFDLSEAPIKGKVWYPAEKGNFPVLFIIHGNHRYTTPSYLGYDYLGEYLASSGYVVVSVDEDFCNQLSNENDARALMLLESIKQVLAYNSSEDNPLYEKIDESRIAIAGHSRGGEAVSTAYLLNQYNRYPGNGTIMFQYDFSIRSILAIAQTVDQYMPGNHEVAFQDVNFLLIHGTNDQDVTTVMGNKQFNNITYSSNGKYFKSALYIGGANHGQFNNRWGRYDLSFPANYLLNVNDFISQKDQEDILKIFTKIYLDVTLKEDKTNERLFKDYRAYQRFLPKTTYQQMYMTSDYEVICDFDEDSSLVTGTREGTTIKVGLVRVWKEVMTPGGSGGAGENYAQRIDWRGTKSASVTYSFSEMNAENRCIRFDLADLSNDTQEVKNNSCIDGEVIIMDAQGNSASTRIRENALVYPSIAVQLHKMDSLNEGYQYKHQMQTVRLEDSKFKENNRKIDMTRIVSIMIKFDHSETGSVKIDNIGMDTK